MNNNFNHSERIVSKTGLLFSVFWLIELFLTTLMIFIDLWFHVHSTCTLHPEKSRLWAFTPEGCFSSCGKKTLVKLRQRKMLLLAKLSSFVLSHTVREGWAEKMVKKNKTKRKTKNLCALVLCSTTFSPFKDCAFFSCLNPSSLSDWLSLCQILKTSNNKA